MPFSLILQGGGSPLVGFLPLILIFVVFYFLIIMPQRKKQREIQEKVSTLKAGDRVMTTGGIIGTITMVRDTSFLVRSAEKTVFEVARSSITPLEAEEEKK